MEQFVPHVTQADIERILRRDFPAEDHEALRARIDSIQVIEKDRVILACMKNSGGKADKLKDSLAEATGYYREILAEAEYPGYLKEWSRIDRLTDDEKRRIIEKDREQYLSWLNRA